MRTDPAGGPPVPTEPGPLLQRAAEKIRQKLIVKDKPHPGVKWVQDAARSVEGAIKDISKTISRDRTLLKPPRSPVPDFRGDEKGPGPPHLDWGSAGLEMSTMKKSTSIQRLKKASPKKVSKQGNLLQPPPHQAVRDTDTARDPSEVETLLPPPLSAPTRRNDGSPYWTGGRSPAPGQRRAQERLEPPNGSPRQPAPPRRGKSRCERIRKIVYRSILTWRTSCDIFLSRVPNELSALTGLPPLPAAALPLGQCFVCLCTTILIVVVVILIFRSVLPKEDYEYVQDLAAGWLLGNQTFAWNMTTLGILPEQSPPDHLPPPAPG